MGVDEEQEIKELEAEIKELEHEKRLQKLRDKKKRLKKEVNPSVLDGFFGK